MVDVLGTQFSKAISNLNARLRKIHPTGRRSSEKATGIRSMSTIFSDSRTDSRSSTSSESGAADIISHLFNPLPDERPKNTSEIDFVIFRLYGYLLSKSPSLNWMSIIVVIFVIFQGLAVITTPGLGIAYSAAQNGGEIDLLSDVLYFFWHFRIQLKPVSMSFYYVLDVIVMLSCILFVTGLVAMHFRKNIHMRYIPLFTLFLIHFPTVMYIPLSQAASTVVIQYIGGNADVSVVCLVFLILAWCANTYLFHYASSCYFNSVFFASGMFVSTVTLEDMEILLACAVFFFTLMEEILSLSQAIRTICILLMILGVVSSVRGCIEYFLSPTMQAYQCSTGITMLFGGIVGILAEQGISPFTRVSLTHVLVIAVSVVVDIVSILIIRAYRKSILKKFEAETDIANLKLKNNAKFMEHLQIGYGNMIESVVNGNFVEEALNSYLRPNHIIVQVVRFGGMFPGTHLEYLELLRKKLEDVGSLSDGDRFAIFEYDRIQSLRHVDRVPESLAASISECEGKISQYPQLRKYLFTHIRGEGEPGITFMILNALASLNTSLRECVTSMRRSSPNSPDVLRLYAMYLGTVCQKYTKASRINTIADDLQRRMIQYVDFTHIRLLSRFPKAQKALIEKQGIQQPKATRLNFSKVRALSSLSIIGGNKSRVSEMRNSSTLKDPSITFTSFYPMVLALLILSTLLFFFVSLGISENVSNKVEWENYLFGNFTEVVGYQYYAIIEVMKYIYINNTDMNAPRVKNVTARYEAFLSSINAAGAAVQGFKYFDRDFDNYFGWINSDPVAVPSYLAGTEFGAEFLVVMMRTYQLLYKIVFPGNDYARNTTETTVLLETVQLANSTSSFAMGKLMSSFDTYRSHVVQLEMMEMVYTAVPFFFFILLFVIFPGFLYREFKSNSRLFPECEQSKTIHIVKLSLSHYFRTFAFYTKLSFLIAVPTVALIIGFIFVVRQERINAFDTLRNDYLDVLRCSAKISVVTDTLDWLYMSQLEVPGYMYNETETVEHIKKNLDYMSSFRFEQFNSDITNAMFSLLINITYQVDQTSLQFDEAETFALTNFVTTNFYNILQIIMISDVLHIYEVSQRCREFAMDTNYGFLIACICLELMFMPIVYNLQKAIKCMSIEVSYLSDAQVAQSKEAQMKGDNILDLVANPCALVDQEQRVLRTNTAWLTFYDESFDRIVGRSIGEIARDENFSTTRIDGTKWSLVTMKETKEDVNMKQKAKNAQRDLDLLKSVDIPSRFISVLSGHESVKFAVIINCITFPLELDKLSPETWPNDCEILENWLKNRVISLPIKEDVDVLHMSSRELSIIFGCKEANDPHALTFSAVILAFDLLRFALETEWTSGPFSICLTVSSGQNLDFEFTRTEVTVATAFGSAVEKQMSLRECVEQNAIVICPETMAILDEMQFRIDLQKTENGNFIFVNTEKSYA